ncbi:MFS transporter [Janibacter hoylei]|uniref:MFS transporter n=1 Tax=Janibacter hoylei TaxID=364298 RepID=UPI002238AE0B|nr:MFS transporter [Janibacter hoylei]MCW4602303.1 MFS transporter [Janibacter hoylei]
MTSPTTASDAVHARATRKAFVRLVPLLMAAYFMAFVDRTNVGLAKSSLEVDAGIDAAAYGLGAGLFFLTYAALEVPSNLILHKIGAKVWIGRIAVTWGLITMAMMFISSPTIFYVLRLLLGAAEAGLYPGIMYLITTWFAQKDRATAVGLILTASSVAFIVANPIGGALMKMDGVGGLHGWQWLFVLEGIPTVLLGVIIFVVLPNSPAGASWLTRDEAAELTRRAVGAEEPVGSPGAIVRQAISTPFLLTVAAIYFMNQIATYGVIFFVPSIVQAMDVTDTFVIGLISGVVGIGAVIGVLVVPRVLRRNPGSEVRLIGITTVAAIVLALCFVAVEQPVARMIILSATMLFIVGVQPLYWSVLMARLGEWVRPPVSPSSTPSASPVASSGPTPSASPRRRPGRRRPACGCSSPRPASGCCACRCSVACCAGTTRTTPSATPRTTSPPWRSDLADETTGRDPRVAAGRLVLPGVPSEGRLSGSW